MSRSWVPEREPIQRIMAVFLMTKMFIVRFSAAAICPSPKEMQQRIGLGTSVINMPLALLIHHVVGKPRQDSPRGAKIPFR